MEIIILDGTKMTSVEETHRYLAAVMRFPSGYGANLDALADCLSTMGSQVCVLLLHAAAMREGLGGYGDRLERVFADISAGESNFIWIVKE